MPKAIKASKVKVRIRLDMMFLFLEIDCAKIIKEKKRCFWTRSELFDSTFSFVYGFAQCGVPFIENRTQTLDIGGKVLRYLQS